MTSTLDSDAEDLKRRAELERAKAGGTGRKANQSGLGVLKKFAKYNNLTAKYRDSAVESPSVSPTPETVEQSRGTIPNAERMLSEHLANTEQPPFELNAERLLSETADAKSLDKTELRNAERMLSEHLANTEQEDASPNAEQMLSRTETSTARPSKTSTRAGGMLSKRLARAGGKPAVSKDDSNPDVSLSPSNKQSADPLNAERMLSRKRASGVAPNTEQMLSESRQSGYNDSSSQSPPDSLVNPDLNAEQMLSDPAVPDPTSNRNVPEMVSERVAGNSVVNAERMLSSSSEPLRKSHSEKAVPEGASNAEQMLSKESLEAQPGDPSFGLNESKKSQTNAEQMLSRDGQESENEDDLYGSQNSTESHGELNAEQMLSSPDQQEVGRDNNESYPRSQYSDPSEITNKSESKAPAEASRRSMTPEAPSNDFDALVRKMAETQQVQIKENRRAKPLRSPRKVTGTPSSARSPSIIPTSSGRAPTQVEGEASALNLSQNGESDSPHRIPTTTTPQADRQQTQSSNYQTSSKEAVKSFEQEREINAEQMLSKHLADTEQIHSEYTANAERMHSKRIANTEQLHSEYIADHLANTEQEIRLEAITGKERAFVDFIYQKCKEAAALYTHPISSKEIATALGIASKDAKKVHNHVSNLIYRVTTYKGFVQRLESVKGKAGWTRFGLTRGLYGQLVDAEKSGRKYLAEYSSEAPINLSITKKEYNNKESSEKTEEKMLYDFEVEDIDLSLVEGLGISKKHLFDIRKNRWQISGDTLREMITRFAYYVRLPDQKMTPPHLYPRIFLALVRDKTTSGESALDYVETDEDRLIRAALSRKQSLKADKDRREADLMEMSYSEWREGLTKEEATSILPKTSSFKLEEGSPPYETLIKQHFRDQVWAEMRHSILNRAPGKDA